MVLTLVLLLFSWVGIHSSINGGFATMFFVLMCLLWRGDASYLVVRYTFHDVWESYFDLG